MRGPAEVPPASYTESFYVDSKGCMFIRAGYGGNVSWVPRVDRSRQVNCNYPPTGVAGATPPAAAQPPQRVAAVPQPAPAPQAAPVAPPPVRTTTTPVTWNWFDGAPAYNGGRGQIPAPVAVAPAAAPVAAPVAAPPRVQAQPVQTAAYSNGGWFGTPLAIRTVPQAVHPADHLNGRLGRVAVAPAAAPPVLVTRAAPVALPEGYVSLLSEGRQAARRGVGTPAGQAAMDLIWTDTMPRRLIDATTGRDVTAEYASNYGVVTTRAYTPAGGVATTAGQPVRYRQRVPDAASPSNMIDLRNIEDTSAPAVAPVEQAAVAAPAPAAGGGQFVQVATFGVPANAERTLARFSAAGLPVYARPVSRGGRTLKIVMLGPFADAASAASALSAARGAGFDDAFIR
ncbi:MAG: SPOR domain-containing protein [Rhodobacteraceae bacterium]|nr:SPOR domain-containing protein [Paracoccaceae bacterium]